MPKELCAVQQNVRWKLKKLMFFYIPSVAPFSVPHCMPLLETFLVHLFAYYNQKLLELEKRLGVRLFELIDTMSGVFCTNNAQAPSLFSNVTVTSRRTKLIVCWNCFEQQCPSSVKWYIPNGIYHLTEEGHCCSKLFQHTINFVRLLVSVTLEKREGACALFVQKIPDMFTNLPSARKTLLDR